MVLFSIPDIRLFWSKDPRFRSQFSPGVISSFKEYSKYPSNWKDVSFWTTRDIHENDVCDLVREAAGDWVEDVKEVSGQSKNPCLRNSPIYRLTSLYIPKRNERVCVTGYTIGRWRGKSWHNLQNFYSDHHRSLSNADVGAVQERLNNLLTSELGVEIR